MNLACTVGGQVPIDNDQRSASRSCLLLTLTRSRVLCAVLLLLLLLTSYVAPLEASDHLPPKKPHVRSSSLSLSFESSSSDALTLLLVCCCCVLGVVGVLVVVLN